MKNIFLVISLMLSSCIGTHDLKKEAYVVNAIKIESDICYCWLPLDGDNANRAAFDWGIWVKCDSTTTIGDTLYLSTKKITSNTDTVYVIKDYNNADTVWYIRDTVKIK